jgi:tyrosyl-DNA phosphodiesterase 2
MTSHFIKSKNKFLITLSVLTWNIWFADTDSNIRLKNLIDRILLLQPDIICLQEVRTEIIRNLITNLQSPYQYYCIILQGNKNPKNDFYGTSLVSKQNNINYSNVIFSRFPLANKKLIEFPSSRMGRNIIMSTFEINKNEFCILTSHLESEFKDFNPTKILQFNQIINMINSMKINNVIFCGDTNIISNDEKYITSYPLIDAYNLSDKKVTYTYNYKTNDYINKKLQERLDRVIYKLNDEWKQIDYKVIDGNNISDHHGVLVTWNSLRSSR